MDKGKRLDISNSKLTNNSKVTINSKDASNSKEAKMEILK
jgi:hypothetical protein